MSETGGYFFVGEDAIRHARGIMSEKIGPALGRDSWRNHAYESDEYASCAMVARWDEHGVHVSEWVGGGPEQETDPVDIPDDAVAPMIAILNAALADDDPRKIRREWVTFLREDVIPMLSETGGRAERDELDVHWARLKRIADVLEGYLPPA